jgi:hypothetical protein
MGLLNGYVFDGIEPDEDTLSSTERAIYRLGKSLLDQAGRENPGEAPGDAEPETVNRVGNKRGAPVGNQNAKKQPKTIENNPETIENNPDHHNINNLKYLKNDDLSVVLEKLRAESARVGYALDEKDARSFLNAPLERDWFLQPFSYLEYMAYRVQEQYKNKKKTADELRNLYRSAITWETLRSGYLPWRETKLVAQKKQRIQALKAQRPTICPKCGAALAGDTCPDCGGFVVFNETALEYVFNPSLEFTAISHEFLKYREAQSKITPKGGPPVHAALG